MLPCTTGGGPSSANPYCPPAGSDQIPARNDGQLWPSEQAKKKSHLLSSRWDQLDASAQTTHPSSDFLVQLRSEPGPIMMDLKAAATWVTTEGLLWLPLSPPCHYYTLKIYLSLLLCTGSSHLQFITGLEKVPESGRSYNCHLHLLLEMMRSPAGAAQSSLHPKSHSSLRYKKNSQALSSLEHL